MSVWVSEWVNERMNEWMNEWTGKQREGMLDAKFCQ